MPILAVAPHWGAWIEIQGCGKEESPWIVAPHWGAWIEIKHFRLTWQHAGGRTPLGCVD